MDLLFSRYASPFEFMRPYIETGRFGEWVTEIIKAENKRRKEQAERDDEEKLWSAFIHSGSDKSFSDWKSTILKPVEKGTGKKDDDMTNADIDKLMKRLFTNEALPQAENNPE